MADESVSAGASIEEIISAFREQCGVLNGIMDKFSLVLKKDDTVNSQPHSSSYRKETRSVGDLSNEDSNQILDEAYEDDIEMGKPSMVTDQVSNHYTHIVIPFPGRRRSSIASKRRRNSIESNPRSDSIEPKRRRTSIEPKQCSNSLDPESAGSRVFSEGRRQKSARSVSRNSRSPTLYPGRPIQTAPTSFTESV
ncbi:hypothetical protein ACHAWF_003269 [Thalassiosira exigua]